MELKTFRQREEFARQMGEQIRLAEGEMEQLRRGYLGRHIAYYNHEVLAVGNGCDEASRRVAEDKKSLPFVIIPVV